MVPGGERSGVCLVSKEGRSLETVVPRKQLVEEKPEWSGHFQGSVDSQPLSVLSGRDIYIFFSLDITCFTLSVVSNLCFFLLFLAFIFKLMLGKLLLALNSLC